MKYLQSSKTMINNRGLSLIEVIIAISIFSIGFMALTATLWSATGNIRTAASCDQAVMAGQDVIEALSVKEMAAVVNSSLSQDRFGSGNRKVQWRVVAAADADGDGKDDFKTIVLEVYHSGDNNPASDDLRMRTFYRRMAY